MDFNEYETLPFRIKQIYNTCSEDEQKYLLKILEELSVLGYSPTYDTLWLQDYVEIPVDKETFLTDDEFLGLTNNHGKAIYPVWMDTMRELERSGNQYSEVVFTGATRTGKTSTAVSETAYQLYRIMCLRDPQQFFGLKSISRISIFFFNITQTLAKGVAFKEFNSTLAVSPWFNKHGHFTKSESNPIYVPDGNLIEITYGSDASHALGKATFAVLFDEANFASAGIKDVKKAKERMKEKYDTLVARVTGTFVKNGEVYGKLYVISSKRSDSDFMEEYIDKQRKAGNPHMYIFDKPQWEVWPKEKYSSDKTFTIALGGKHLSSFVVPDDQDTPEGLAELTERGYSLMQVPEDNKVRFLSDFDVALRDIAGKVVFGSMSFINQASIDECIGVRKSPFIHDILEIGTKDNYSIEEFFHLEFVDKSLLKCPIFIHLDLSKSDDKTGIGAIAVSGRKDIITEDERKVSVPTFSQLFSIAIKAPKGDKIPYLKIMTFIVWLKNHHFNIVMISKDTYQSEYMGQLLESKGFTVKDRSLDRTPDGYTTLRSIILEQRIDLLDVELYQEELIHLQRDGVTGKVDHPVGGCFTGDTKIKLVDGRCPTIKELMKERIYDNSQLVYTFNELIHRIEIKPIKKIFKTKHVDCILEVTLSNGRIIHCTKDHRFMLYNGLYEEAQYLKKGMALMPCIARVPAVMNKQGQVITYIYYEPKMNQWFNMKRLKKIDDRYYDDSPYILYEKQFYKNYETVHSIAELSIDCDVYDLEIADNHNFALEAGVFVHNSKDTSDCLAGSVWSAVLENPGINIDRKSVAKSISHVNGSRRFTGSNPDVNRMFPDYKKYN